MEAATPYAPAVKVDLPVAAGRPKVLRVKKQCNYYYHHYHYYHYYYYYYYYYLLINAHALSRARMLV